MPSLLRVVALSMALASASASAASPMLRAPNDPAIWYSPYQWSVGPSTATTLNTGATLRVLFSGTFLNLTYDVSAMVSPPSQLYYRVDQGGLTPFTIAPVVPVYVPINNTHGDVPFHTLEVIVKSMTERANRWAVGVPSTRVVFTGLVTDGELLSWIPAPLNLLIYGDSITEGVLTLGGSQPFDTDHNDATVVWSWRLGGLLGAETGVVGFGATGLSRGGSGGVPALGVSWNQLWNNTPRVFSPQPDLIVFNEGTNDGNNNITAAFIAVLDELMDVNPGTPVAMLLPFNGAQAANLKNAAAGAKHADDVHFVDTAGFYNTSIGGGLHPTGPNDVARIAPQVAAAVRKLIKT